MFLKKTSFGHGFGQLFGHGFGQLFGFGHGFGHGFGRILGAVLGTAFGSVWAIFLGRLWAASWTHFRGQFVKKWGLLRVLGGFVGGLSAAVLGSNWDPPQHFQRPSGCF